MSKYRGRNVGKYGVEKNPYLDNFHVVKSQCKGISKKKKDAILYYTGRILPNQYVSIAGRIYSKHRFVYHLSTNTYQWYIACFPNHG